jgi:hypothetical protein
LLGGQHAPILLVIVQDNSKERTKRPHPAGRMQARNIVPAAAKKASVASD